ncbi:MAG: nickel pincer cofactor biosynthesis protein LarC [Eubacteriales bacterium]|nr:nickel pincer cofactor biosynthesis protein LarC [Eubacteriales bacterium]
MEKLYLECYSGISGDMTVAALLDLGADERVLREALESLPVKGFEIRISRVRKAGLDVCDFDVVLDRAHENHDHDMEYLHGAGRAEAHTHGTGHEHAGAHAHGESHSHGTGHEHRGMKEIMEILDGAKLTDRARATAKRIFTILGEAEAKAHGTTLEQVHFHEVGAVDSIVDIVAAAVCLDNLDIDQVIVPELWEGGGTIRCRHGILPVPVPAVANIAAAHGLALHLTGENGEYVTPTGAAIAAAVRTSDRLPDTFTVERIGLGAGKRQYERPGILRALLIRCGRQDGTDEDEIYKLESNIDDCTGEALGYVMERLLEAGARDVHYIPVYMKKNRPAWQLNVICLREDISVMERIIFGQTTTIGIRRVRMGRTVLRRRSQIVHTPLGDACVKLCSVPDGSACGEERCYPEFDSVAELCAKSGRSYEDVYRMIVRAWEKA